MVTLILSSDNNLTPFLLFTASSSNPELKSSLTAAESAHSKKVSTSSLAPSLILTELLPSITIPIGETYDIGCCVVIKKTSKKRVLGRI